MLSLIMAVLSSRVIGDDAFACSMLRYSKVIISWFCVSFLDRGDFNV